MKQSPESDIESIVSAKSKFLRKFTAVNSRGFWPEKANQNKPRKKGKNIVLG
jgi:hypothetical protein